MDAILVLGAATGFSVILVLLVLIRQQRQLRQMNDIKHNSEALAASLKKLQGHCKTQEEKLFELTTAVSGMSERLQSISRQHKELESESRLEIKKLSEKLQELESADPGSRMYTKAAKLVASGASIEEVMQECELPRAEAELLMNLHTRS